jgi:ribose 5-phosphate isomerase A
MGVAPRLRVRDGAPVVTDNGNMIYDAACGVILDPALLAEALKSVTGVVDHGLFLDLADEALIATDNGVEHLIP